MGWCRRHPGLVAAGIAVEPHSDAGFDRIQIDGNTIRFTPSEQPTTSDDQSAGIELWLSDAAVVSRNVSVTNNEISGSYGPGIRLSMSGYGIDIAHNVVRNASQSSAAFPDAFHSAIMVSHRQHGLTIHDNLLVDDQPATTVMFGVLDATTEGSMGLRAVDNQLRTSAATVPAFQNTRGGSAFFVSYIIDSPPVLPTYPVKWDRPSRTHQQRRHWCRSIRRRERPGRAVRNHDHMTEVRKRTYLSPPDTGPEERRLLLDAFDSNWVAPLGPHVDAFEREFADLVGAASCRRLVERNRRPPSCARHPWNWWW